MTNGQCAIKLVEIVETMLDASQTAREWTQRWSCDPEKHGMPCQCLPCTKRGAGYAAEFARKAAHEANKLLLIARVAAGAPTP